MYRHEYILLFYNVIETMNEFLTHNFETFSVDK